MNEIFRNHIDKFGATFLSEGLEQMRFLVNLKLNLQEFKIPFSNILK